MNSLDRYKRRKSMTHQISNTIIIDEDINQKEVDNFIKTKVDTNLIQKTAQTMDEHYKFEYDFNVSKDEAKEFLEKFKNEFNQERFDKLIDDCKKEVINSIVTPFGLGKIVAAYDKLGGNVDTVHNARGGIYATEKEQTTYENRGDYQDKKIKKNYHDGDPNYTNKKEEFKNKQLNGTLNNEYSGKKIPTSNPNDPTTQVEVEHVISTKEIHNDAGRILADSNGIKLANTDSNLVATTKSVNGSKQDEAASDFLQRVKNNKEKIKKLEAKENLTPEEQQGLDRLKRVTDVDEETVKKLDKKARKKYNQEINKTYYTSGKFVKNTAITGGKEGVKMGMQQAIGLVMSEFFTALFDEILDIYKNGFSSGFEDDRFFSVLKERLKTIAKKLQDKWKEVAIAFKDGFISGFISNLVTTVINAFVTTGKRLIRIIREGIFSLFKAVKILLFPPENLTYEEAMHEAKKIIASGLIISLGVIAEQYIDTLIKGTVVLEPFTDILTTVFVGAITGLAVTMTVYYLDKKKNDKDSIKLLTKEASIKFDNVELLLSKLKY